MTGIAALDVIWIDDETIAPPKPKMVVCIHPENGWFLRVNSKNRIRPCVPLPREPNHTFLKHDSFISCDLLELDEFVIEGILIRKGIIGTIDAQLRNELKKGLLQSRSLSNRDRLEIFQVFDSLDDEG